MIAAYYIKKYDEYVRNSRLFCCIKSMKSCLMARGTLYIITLPLENEYV